MGECSGMSLAIGAQLRESSPTVPSDEPQDDVVRGDRDGCRSNCEADTCNSRRAWRVTAPERGRTPLSRWQSSRRLGEKARAAGVQSQTTVMPGATSRLRSARVPGPVDTARIVCAVDSPGSVSAVTSPNVRSMTWRQGEVLTQRLATPSPRPRIRGRRVG